jgi:hypothetical protein
MFPPTRWGLGSPHLDGAGKTELEAVALRRVVRGGDHHAERVAILPAGEVQLVDADHPQVDDVGTLSGDAVDERRVQRGRREAHVSPHNDLGNAEAVHGGGADAARRHLIELIRMGSADVIGLEDGCINHPWFSN